MKVFVVRTPMRYGPSILSHLNIEEFHRLQHTEELEEKLRVVAADHARSNYSHPIHDVFINITDYCVYENSDQLTASIFIRFGHSDTLIHTTDKTEWNRLKLTNPELIFEELDE